MKLVTALVASVVLVACAADGEVKVKASSDESTASASANANANASADTEPKSETKTTAAKPSEEAPAPTAPTSGEPAAPQACPLQCFVAQKGRVAPADEQRLAGELADALSSLRGCGPGNSLTIRFDSTGQLTEFGVAADRGAENACVDSVRQKKPNVSYPGPSTLRCYEKCGGDTSTRSTRRRKR
jgi:pyruvate/2-oxoglutarate dehydrogenase complex dihydrolipoamide acyltransferase (E2) component